MNQAELSGLSGAADAVPETESWGWLLVGHGTREAVGVAEFLQVASLTTEAAGPAIVVEPCFLEFAQPTIAEGLAALVRRGVRRVVVAPVLLFAAGHAKRDIPEAVAAAVAALSGLEAGSRPEIEIVQSAHLGCHPALIALSRARGEVGQSNISHAETAWVMVGRGSHDPQAIAEMHQFVEQRAAGLGYARVDVAFVAMAEPTLTSVLDALAQSANVVAAPTDNTTRPVKIRRVVVQPHLLFGGVLLDRIATVMREFAERRPDIEWVVAPHLGPDVRVAEAIVARAKAMLAKQAE